MNLKQLSNFQQRFLMSFLGILLLAVVILLSHTSGFEYLFVLALALVQAGALSEYYRLSELKGFEPVKKMAVCASIIYIFLHHALPAIPFLLILLALAFVIHFTKHETSLGNLAVTLFGILYITIPLSFVLNINFLDSSWWFVYLLITTKITDTAAYSAGKLWGQHLLAPTLSPKKTKEGAIAGLVASTLTSIIFLAIYKPPGFTTFDAALLGASIGIISQIGDLAESLIKRDANVKDSSTLPGFGGMLDVVDSLLFTTPLLYFWLNCKGIL